MTAKKTAKKTAKSAGPMHGVESLKIGGNPFVSGSVPVTLAGGEVGGGEILDFSPSTIHLNEKSLSDQYFEFGSGDISNPLFVEFITDEDLLQTLYLVLSDRDFFRSLTRRIFGDNMRPYFGSRFPRIEAGWVLEQLDIQLREMPIDGDRKKVLWAVYELIVGALGQSKFVNTDYRTNYHCPYTNFVPNMNDYINFAMRSEVQQLVNSVHLDITRILPSDGRDWHVGLVARALAETFEPFSHKARSLVQAWAVYKQAVVQMVHATFGGLVDIPAGPATLRDHPAVLSLRNSITFLEAALDLYNSSDVKLASGLEFVVTERSLDALDKAIRLSDLKTYDLEDLQTLMSHAHIATDDGQRRGVLVSSAFYPVINPELRVYRVQEGGVCRALPETDQAPGLGGKLNAIAKELHYRTSAAAVMDPIYHSLQVVAHSIEDEPIAVMVAVSPLLLRYYAMSISSEWTMVLNRDKENDLTVDIIYIPTTLHKHTLGLGTDLLTTRFDDPLAVLLTSTQANELKMGTTSSGSNANLERFLKFGLPRAPEENTYIDYEEAWAAEHPALDINQWKMRYATISPTGTEEFQIALSTKQLFESRDLDKLIPWRSEASTALVRLAFRAIAHVFEYVSASPLVEESIRRSAQHRLVYFYHDLYKGVSSTAEGYSMFVNMKRFIKTEGKFADMSFSEANRLLSHDTFELTAITTLTFCIMHYLDLIDNADRLAAEKFIDESDFYSYIRTNTLLKDKHS